MKTLKVLKYVGFGILGLAFLVLVVLGIQALWNWLIPELFHGPVLTFWQTVGLFILAKILLTGVAPGSKHDHRKDWKNKLTIFQGKNYPKDIANPSFAYDGEIIQIPRYPGIAPFGVVVPLPPVTVSCLVIISPVRLQFAHTFIVAPIFATMLVY